MESRSQAPIEYLESLMLSVFYQLLSVVNYLHQRNIVHRDIRLETVYVDQQNDEVQVQLMNLTNAVSISNRE